MIEISVQFVWTVVFAKGHSRDRQAQWQAATTENKRNEDKQTEKNTCKFHRPDAE